MSMLYKVNSAIFLVSGPFRVLSTGKTHIAAHGKIFSCRTMTINIGRWPIGCQVAPWQILCKRAWHRWSNFAMRPGVRRNISPRTGCWTSIIWDVLTRRILNRISFSSWVLPNSDSTKNEWFKTGNDGVFSTFSSASPTFDPATAGWVIVNQSLPFHHGVHVKKIRETMGIKG